VAAARFYAELRGVDEMGESERERERARARACITIKEALHANQGNMRREGAPAEVLRDD
jgi:hypothetical protein